MSWAVVPRMQPTDLRNFEKMVAPNDGTRTLIESIMSRNVIAALDDWRWTGLGVVLIGSVALSYYSKPRFTDQIELLLPDDVGQPELTGFERLEERTLIHQQTSTKVSLLAPNLLGLSKETVEHIIATTVASDGIEIASPTGLVAVLLADPRARASADIVSLLQLDKLDFGGWGLTPTHLERLARLRTKADDERRRALAWEARTGEPW